MTSSPLLSSPLCATAVVATALGAAAALTACSPSDDRETSRSSTPAAACPVAPDEAINATVRIGYQHIPNADLIVKESGILETCLPNADIEWSKFASGGDVIQAFGARSLDIGLLGSSPAAKALSAPLNISMKVIWVHDVIGAAESLAVKDTSINDITELKGKKIGVPFASTSHYSLLAALNRAGISQDVKLIDLKPDAIRAAWTRDEIDAAWVWEPTLSELLEDGKVLVSGADTAAQGAPTFDLGGATTVFVESNPEVMQMWTVAQNWAVTQIKSDPETASERIAGEIGAPAEKVAKQMEGYAYLDAGEQASEKYLGGGLATDLEKTAQFLLTEGEVGAVSSPDVYADGTYSDAAKAVSEK